MTLCACTTPKPPADDTPAAEFPHWPASLNDFRFHWYAASGIDLEREPAVALRAYIESYRLVALTEGDTSAEYDGFRRATPENDENRTRRGTLVQLVDVRPYEAPIDPRPSPPQLFGYEPIHVLDLALTGDTYTAIVCQGTYGTYRRDESQPDKFRSLIAQPDTLTPQFGEIGSIQIWRVDLTDADPRVGANPPATPTAAQRGPMPAPSNDVFGRWFITGASTSLWGPLGDADSVDPPEVRQRCEDAMPDDAAARKAMYSGLHDQPPPHGDPIPGWPNASG